MLLQHMLLYGPVGAAGLGVPGSVRVCGGRLTYTRGPSCGHASDPSAGVQLGGVITRQLLEPAAHW